MSLGHAVVPVHCSGAIRPKKATLLHNDNRFTEVLQKIEKVWSEPKEYVEEKTLI